MPALARLDAQPTPAMRLAGVALLAAVPLTNLKLDARLT